MEGTEEHDDFKQPTIGNLEGLRGNDDDFYMFFTIKNGDLMGMNGDLKHQQ